MWKTNKQWAQIPNYKRFPADIIGIYNETTVYMRPDTPENDQLIHNLNTLIKNHPHAPLALTPLNCPQKASCLAFDTETGTWVRATIVHWNHTTQIHKVEMLDCVQVRHVTAKMLRTTNSDILQMPRPWSLGKVAGYKWHKNLEGKPVTGETDIGLICMGRRVWAEVWWYLKNTPLIELYRTETCDDLIYQSLIDLKLYKKCYDDLWEGEH